MKYIRVQEDRRQYQRLPINLPVSFAGDNASGDGVVSDISLNGCTFHSASPPPEGGVVRIEVRISDDQPPVIVEAAAVRTVRQDRVGVEFLRFQQPERERLQLFIRGLLIGRRS